jgi:hypothetical protein
LCNCAPERVRVDVVHEPAPAVDLDDRDPLPVRRLELGIAVDRNLRQLEAELVARGGDDTAGSRAEVAASRGEENYLCYG